MWSLSPLGTHRRWSRVAAHTTDFPEPRIPDNQNMPGLVSSSQVLNLSFSVTHVLVVRKRFLRILLSGLM
jgi:hypothetical protein